MASISCGADFAADSAANGYIAVKYSGTATFGELSIYGTKDGGEVKSGVVANIAGSGWNVTKTVGSDFSVVVAQIGGYYGAGELNIDTITNVGFNLTGEGDQTFTVLGIEFLANANHNFGTPTPPVVEPGELTIGDLVPAGTATDTPLPKTATIKPCLSAVIADTSWSNRKLRTIPKIWRFVLKRNIERRY